VAVRTAYTPLADVLADVSPPRTMSWPGGPGTTTSRLTGAVICQGNRPDSAAAKVPGVPAARAGGSVAARAPVLPCAPVPCTPVLLLGRIANHATTATTVMASAAATARLRRTPTAACRHPAPVSRLPGPGRYRRRDRVVRPGEITRRATAKNAAIFGAVRRDYPLRQRCTTAKGRQGADRDQEHGARDNHCDTGRCRRQMRLTVSADACAVPYAGSAPESVLHCYDGADQIQGSRRHPGAYDLALCPEQEHSTGQRGGRWRVAQRPVRLAAVRLLCHVAFMVTG